MNVMQITTRIGCTNACIYCPQDILIKEYKKHSDNLLMSFDLFQAYISKIPTDVDIWFAGMCEPWLNPDCAQMLLYAHNRGHKISVFTTLNGMRLSDISLLEPIPFGFFQVHLPSNRKYEQIRVDNCYLTLLNKLLTNNIHASFHCHGGTVHPQIGSLLKRHQIPVNLRSLNPRSGNITISNRQKPLRKRGVISCSRNSLSNVLLPNGDVLLCSNDYGMKHVLGNLNTSEYTSLFQRDMFRMVIRGQQDESEDILCRYCDNFCRDVDLSAHIFNFPYRLDRYLYYLKDIKGLNDLRHLIQKGIGRARTKIRNINQR